MWKAQKSSNKNIVLFSSSYSLRVIHLSFFFSLFWPTQDEVFFELHVTWSLSCWEPAASSNNRLCDECGHVCVCVCVCVSCVAVLLLTAGFEGSGSLWAPVCLIAFLSHWSAVAAILLPSLRETVNGRGSNLLHCDCPSKSCSQATLSPGNLYGSHRRRQRERERERISLMIDLSTRFPYLISGSVWSFFGFHCSSGCKCSLSVKRSYYISITGSYEIHIIHKQLMDFWDQRDEKWKIFHYVGQFSVRFSAFTSKTWA